MFDGNLDHSAKQTLSNRSELALEHYINATCEFVWDAWTVPELFAAWFAPLPYRIKKAEIDPVPGGIYSFVMCSTDGRAYSEQPGCVLVAEPQKRLVWTDALGPEFRPNKLSFITVDVELTAKSNGTVCKVVARHKSSADCQFHEQMGFQRSWIKSLHQLECLATA